MMASTSVWLIARTGAGRAAAPRRCTKEGVLVLCARAVAAPADLPSAYGSSPRSRFEARALPLLSTHARACVRSRVRVL